MLTIYHAPGTRSIRPIWLCCELDMKPEADFHVEPIEFSHAFLSSKAWREISPAGKVPILKDGALTMFESGAMMDYLLERYDNGRLKPKAGSVESALHQQWSWFSEATLLRPLGLNRLLRNKDEQPSQLIADAKTKLSSALRVVEQALENNDYLLGQSFYSADIMMGYSLELIRQNNLLTADYPNAQRYLASLKTRAACKQAMNA